MSKDLSNMVNEESTFRFRIEAKLKNADLVRARESLGLTAKEAAEQIGVSYSSYVSVETMQCYPSPQTQDKICDFYLSKGIPIFREDVFPEELRKARSNTKYVTEREIPREMLISLQEADRRHLLIYNPEQEINVDDLKSGLDKAIEFLTPREAYVVSSYYGLDSDKGSLTLEQMGVRMNLPRARVSKILSKAIRRLRNSQARNHLRDFL